MRLHQGEVATSSRRSAKRPGLAGVSRLTTYQDRLIGIKMPEVCETSRGTYQTGDAIRLADALLAAGARLA